MRGLRGRLQQIESRVMMCPEHHTPRLCPRCDIFDLSVLSEDEQDELAQLVDLMPEPIFQPTPRYCCGRCAEEWLECLPCCAAYSQPWRDTPEQRDARARVTAICEKAIRPEFWGKMGCPVR
jgi:hypothetical protein